jgi:hypothetical protein
VVARALCRRVVEKHNLPPLEYLFWCKSIAGCLAGGGADDHNPGAAASDTQLAAAAASVLIGVAGVPGARELLQAHGAAKHLAAALRAPAALRGTPASLTLMVAFSAAVGGCRAAQDAAAEAGGVEAAVHLLHRGRWLGVGVDVVELQHTRKEVGLRALGVVTALCACHAENRERMRIAGAVPLVVGLLSPHAPAGYAEHAAVALCHLAANDRESADDIEQEGGLVALAAFWYHHLVCEERLARAVTAGLADVLYEHARPRDVAERALYELARMSVRLDELVAAAKRAVRAGRLTWEGGPKEWREGWRGRERASGGCVVIDIGTAALTSTRAR